LYLIIRVVHVQRLPTALLWTMVIFLLQCTSSH